LLPSGAVLVGGGAKMTNVAELAKDILGLPVQIGFPAGLGGMLDKVDDPSFATVAGLILWGRQQEDSQTGGGLFGNKTLGVFTHGSGETMNKIRGLFKKFLP